MKLKGVKNLFIFLFISVFIISCGSESTSKKKGDKFEEKKSEDLNPLSFIRF